MFDIAVVGSGPAGSVAALTAARAGARVLLLDGTAGRRTNVGETLPPLAGRVLDALGLQALMQHGHRRVVAVQSAWAESLMQERNALFDERGAGWRLDREQFARDIRRCLTKAGVTVSANSALLDFEATRSRWILHVRNAGSLHEASARGLIDATGRPAQVARKLGVRRIQHDRLVGALLEHPATDVDGDALCVEAASYGWWYTVGTKPGNRVFGLMTDSDILRARGARAAPAWWQLLAGTTLIRRFAAAASANAPVIVPAGGSRLAQFAGSRWIAAGDAAIAFDPLSTQGVTTALMTGYRAALSLLHELDGQGGGHNEYAAFVTRIDADYRDERIRHYSTNARFATETFWRRRRG